MQTRKNANPGPFQYRRSLDVVHKTFEVLFYRQQRSLSITSGILNFFESRNNDDDKFGLFMAAEVNELVFTSELGE